MKSDIELWHSSNLLFCALHDAVSFWRYGLLEGCGYTVTDSLVTGYFDDGRVSHHSTGIEPGSFLPKRISSSLGLSSILPASC